MARVEVRPPSRFAPGNGALLETVRGQKGSVRVDSRPALESAVAYVVACCRMPRARRARRSDDLAGTKLCPSGSSPNGCDRLVALGRAQRRAPSVSERTSPSSSLTAGCSQRSRRRSYETKPLTRPSVSALFEPLRRTRCGLPFLAEVLCAFTSSWVSSRGHARGLPRRACSVINPRGKHCPSVSCPGPVSDLSLSLRRRTMALTYALALTSDGGHLLAFAFSRTGLSATPGRYAEPRLQKSAQLQSVLRWCSAGCTPWLR